MSVEDRLEHLLRAHGIDGISGENVLSAIDVALSAASGSQAPLTIAEEDFLHAHGGPAAQAALEQRDPARDAAAAAADAARRIAALIAGSLSLNEAAQQLGVDRSRVSRRCSAGRIFSFHLDGAVRIPRWQLTGDRILPGLDVVVGEIPAQATPLLVEAVMTRPQEETGGRTPIDFLAEGGSPAVVAELLADLDRW